ncbi:MAG: protein kinase [Alphaproteobacteria bacterium]|nr:protein kinase [Alphaproteobacteria bacterium]MCB9695987.1 protein kinase [Alphaproteobacteria bacterium]
MSTVYRAYDTKLGVWRAMKILNPQHARRARLRNRFESEARTMARLEHPNLVRIYDVGVEGKLPFMIMEIVMGGSLQEWVERHGPMPLPLAFQATRQVLLGVACVHEAGIVHRDIKPHNVLVAPPGICKLTDFGIAQIQDDARTKTGSVLGTQGYMAPEQRLDAKSVDHRADLYGVGAMLWSLLTGRIAQDLYNFAKQPKLSKGLDPRAIPVLTHSLTYAREDRYQDAASMLADVDRVLAEIGSDGSEVRHLPDDVTRNERFDFDVMEELAFILVEGRTSEDVPDEDLPRSMPPKVLPYYMPKTEAPKRAIGARFEEETETSLPSWIDRESLNSDSKEEVIGVDLSPQHVRVTPVGSPNVPEAPTPPPVQSVTPEPSRTPPPQPRKPAAEQEPPKRTPPPPRPPVVTPTQDEEPESVVSRLVTIAMVPIAALVGLFALLAIGVVFTVNIAANEVNGAARNAEEARQQLHEALRQEQDIVKLLGEVGADREQLEGLFLVYQELKTEPERTRAAIELLDACESEGQRWVDEQGGTPAQVQANHTLRRLRSAHRAYDASMKDWRESTDGVMGWMATHVGGASAPR